MKNDINQKFSRECEDRVNGYPDTAIEKTANDFLAASMLPKYSYNFRWLGRPIIQYPQDMVAMQEIIWQVKPDLIIETGIAHGGSLMLNASMLAMLDYCEAVDAGKVLNPKASTRKVLGIDIELREHNRDAIEKHPLSHMIELVIGSSIAEDVVKRVREIALSYKTILVCLDSNHTHEHVLKELEAYANLTSVNSYCVVFDSVIEDLPDELFPGRPWGKGNNPKTAAKQWLASNPEFVIDKNMDNKLLISVVSDGYLKRIR